MLPGECKMSRQKMPIFNDRRFLAYLLKLGAEHCRERTFLMKLAQLWPLPFYTLCRRGYAQPFAEIFCSTNIVLFMVCQMYGLTYIDRIHVNTAGPSFAHDLHLSTVQLGWVFSAFGLGHS
jgi:hypothetical protein